MTVEVISNNEIQVSIVETPAIEIEIIEDPAITVEVLPGGFSQQIISTDPEYAISVGVIESDPLVFKEFTYTSGDLTQIDIWDDQSKTTLLMRKVLSYSNGDLSNIVTTHSGISVQTNYTFTSGDLTSIDMVRL